MKLLVLGGGVAGLATALATGRAGHDVVLVERDTDSPVGAAAEVFESWQRTGVAQFAGARRSPLVNGRARHSGTPQGRIRPPSPYARVGVQEHRAGDGEIDRDRTGLAGEVVNPVDLVEIGLLAPPAPHP